MCVGCNCQMGLGASRKPLGLNPTNLMQARTALISSTLTCFFSSVRSAASFFISYMRVPAASSSMPRISGGFMFRTCHSQAGSSA